MAPKPKPKFDPISGKWVVTNWDGTISGIPNGHLRSFENIPKNKENSQPSTSYDQKAPPSSSFDAQSTTSHSRANESKLTKDINKESDNNEVNLLPFALVDEVALNSPASTAGLKKEDLIVKFGTITYSNHRQLRAIAELVPLAAAEEKEIPIVVLRGHRSESETHGSGNDSRNDDNTEKDGSKTTRLIIRPRPWNGRGLIGCHIKPYSS